MLFIPPGLSQITRLHGAYVEDEEIQKITTYLKSQGKPVYRDEILLSDDEDDKDGKEGEKKDGKEGEKKDGKEGEKKDGQKGDAKDGEKKDGEKGATGAGVRLFTELATLLAERR